MRVLSKYSYFSMILVNLFKKQYLNVFVVMYVQISVNVVPVNSFMTVINMHVSMCI